LTGIFLLILIGRLQMRGTRPAPDGIVLGPHEVSILEEGVRNSSERHESLFRWQTVRSADTTAQHIFIMVDRCAAVIVPRRAFTSDEERERFVSEIKARASGARP